ncbi:putative signal transduction protein with CBS domains [Dinoroseobacter shibae DFL 12 = DSM 16493]|uniref:Putative signal transduction protein with CBS domains n=1 Tax=Dinoroseobacter shibae (strain DSM 16493 / NCIMB 14021 / DFL 12) TaxID=398580 RepID=A8LN50_DINSH|nr:MULTISPECIES: CBS domain-containing protein [Dinoroseobacter]ABV92194.1 putative signal transduction protein with CBS domains [Dinoroseobacter shibae DFL 12 = DSM 16493]MDD9717394.1 CBS domain-containing protein [Dinoroseobacter sp. PD6]URF47148.1 CBS domain-containing protein [Dinoroseobacter shibae]URF51459.1 CBS domain-containing protein [Dinoroseobacter shibae]
MLVSRIMRKPVMTVAPEASVQTAAALMANLDIGALAVVDDGRPVGILTDRDIVVRHAAKAGTDALVGTVMTPCVVTCRSDQTIERAAHLMADRQIRRLVVLDADNRVVGLLSLGDIANDASEELAGQTLGEIVETR